jgi:hypothetical protein
MVRLVLAVLMILTTSGAAFAQWQLYRENKQITASFKYQSFARFRNKPSVWVRWHYNSPGGKYGGKLIQFTADCKEHKLFEISVIPYDHDGDFLGENRHNDAPIEYRLKKGSLNSATYRLLCH